MGTAHEMNRHAGLQVMKVGEEPSPMAPAMKPSKAAESKKESKTKTNGRFTVINNFVDVTMKELNRAEISVWLLLYRDTKPDGLARTAQSDLARRAGTTTRTVERAVNSLERRGLLTVVQRGGLRCGASIYRVHPLTKELLPMPTRPR